MSTDYYRACPECRPPHVHPATDGDTSPVARTHWAGDRLGMVVKLSLTVLEPDTLLVNDYGETETVAELTARNGSGRKEL